MPPKRIPFQTHTLDPTESDISTTSTESDSDDNHKDHVINLWMEGVPLYKRRKTRAIACQIYDKLQSMPKRSTILTSKMSFNEKYNIMEQIEILQNMMAGTEDFFQKKRDILKRIEEYDKIEETSQTLEDAERECDKLVSVEPIPLKIQIIRSDVSHKNKIVLLERLKILDTLSTGDDTHAKLMEWIKWGLQISDMIFPLGVSISDGPNKIHEYLYNVKQYMDSKLFGMVRAKERLLELLALRIRNPEARSMSLALCGPPGVGKCLHPDTQILLFFGGMKAAKNIARGDILMGDDNQPRIVMSTSSGIDQMYRIIPEVGDPFITNSVHVLSLYNEFNGQVIDIPLNEYITKADSWKSKHKLFSKPVEYQRQAVKNDPYLVGLLLGSEKKSIDDVIKDYLTKKLDEISACVNSNKTPIALETIDKAEIGYLLNHKYIPDEYLYNTRDVRHKLIKGFCDANTFSTSSSNPNSKPASRSSSITRSNTKNKSVPTTPTSSKSPRSASQPQPRTSSQPRKSILKKPSEHPNTPKPKSPSVQKNSSSITRTPKSSTAPPKKYTGRAGTPGPIESKKTKEQVRTPLNGLKIFYNLDNNTSNKSRTSRLEDFRETILTKKSKTIKVKDKILYEQFKFLIRSLGFECYQLIDSIVINNDISELPDITTKNQTTFTVTPYERGDYTGFTLDGNGRFLLASCMVTHNTELMQTFCDATNQPFAKINMGGSVDPTHYLGHSYTYIGSTPGILVRTLTNLKTSNNQRTKSGVLFFDEFDKIGLSSHVGNVFLHVSDPVQQKSFQDHYMPEITIDLSNITFVYSMNDRKNIDAVLQNRLPIVDLTGYTLMEKETIVKRYIIPKALVNANITNDQVIFSNEAIREIVQIANLEDRDGLRRITQYIQNIVNKIGALLCCSADTVDPTKKIFSYSISGELPIPITIELLNQLKIFDQSVNITHLSMYC